MSTDDAIVAKRDAEEMIEERNSTAWEPRFPELSDRDMDALLDAIANPPPPNAAMLRAVERWRKSGSPQ
ncbi:MAG: DUF1778 domain-containing protein [Chloroflexia bacterium]|nr:DUF1778 domain-containing protein [Chloroflexia bacterium]